MIETMHRTPAMIPDVECEHCGKTCGNQVYTLTLTRAALTREWVFDTLRCLRKFAEAAT